MEQLATRLLVDELKRRLCIIEREENEDLLSFMLSTFLNDLDQFSKIEKENIIKSFDKGYETPFSDDDENYTKGTEYYYENYGKQNIERGLLGCYEYNPE